VAERAIEAVVGVFTNSASVQNNDVRMFFIENYGIWVSDHRGRLHEL
jgi:hypothetical protein